MKYSKAIAAAAAQGTGTFYVCKCTPGYYLTDNPKTKPVSVVTVTVDVVHVEGSPDTTARYLPEMVIRSALREIWRQEQAETLGE